MPDGGFIQTKARRTASKRTSRVPVRSPSPAPVLRLERPTIQTALKVGPANDPLEHQADAMADRVTTMSAPSLDAAPPPDDPPADAMAQREMPAQDTQPNTDEFESAPDIPADHQDPDIPTTEDVDTANVEEDEFAEIEAGEPASPNDLLRDAAPAAVGREGGDAPSDVTRAVAQPGAGRPLPDGVRAFMEPRFGVSFADVRIHDQPGDRRTAARIGARAFAHRNHIWMGEGESVDNRRLMAHELTHVVQQTKRDPAPGAARAEEVTQTDEAAPVRRGWAADKAESYARDVPGYTLLTVILGKSPITGRRVSRNATNLIGGFLGLIPGGNALFEKLQETRALERAYEWVTGRLSDLNITWSRISGLIDDFLDEMPDLDPVGEAKRIFRPLVNDVITFVKDIKDKVLEFIVRGALTIAGPYGEKIWGVIEKARDTISTIIADPLGFAKNLVAAIVGGFKQFGANILGHVKAGLMGWLFGTMAGAGIELPDKLDFKGVVSIALQILGLTYANFRAILVKKLGKKGEEKVAFLEKSVEVVKILLTEGFLGVWQRLLEMIDNFKQTVIDGIRDFVINTIVMGAISWVAGLSNPIGGVVKICLSIYNMIVAFIERLDQIMDVANSIFSSIGAIAKGKTKDAANFIEKTIAGTIPIFLAFVSALIPVTGITKTIKNIIKKLQAPVKKAMEKFAGFLVKKAKKLFSKLLGKVNDKRKLKKEGFKAGKDKHELVPKPKGDKFELEIQSKPERSDTVQKKIAAENKRAKEFGDDSQCKDLFVEAFEVDIDKAEKAAKKIARQQKKKPTTKPAADAAKEIKAAADKLTKLGPCLAKDRFFEDEPPKGQMIRAREPRLPEIEGKSGKHSDRTAETGKTVGEISKEFKLGARGQKKLSLYYENDHIPERSYGEAVKAVINERIKPEIAKGHRDGPPMPKEEEFGSILTTNTDKPGGSLQAITVYRPLHRQKTSADAEKRDHKGKILKVVKEGDHPATMLSELKKHIRGEMEKELNSTVSFYNADKDVTARIKGQLNKGIKDLKANNQPIFATTAGKTDEAKSRKQDKAGTVLPMDGTPNFAEYEGALVPYKKGGKIQSENKGTGTHLEFDHIVEKSLANKARDMVVGTDDLKAVSAPAIADKLKKKKFKDDDEKKAYEAEVQTRLDTIYVEKPFAGQPVQEYNEMTAGTVGLYRPVHQSLSKPPTKLIKKGEYGDITKKLAAYAVDRGDDARKESQKNSVKKQMRGQVRDRFNETMTKHISEIKTNYDIEMKEFAALNTSKEAVSTMAGIIGRVGASTKQLHAESLALLGPK